VIRIRRYRESDWPAVWAMVRAANAGGDVFALAPESSEAECRSSWTDAPRAVYVACDGADRIVGCYYIKPNQPGLGAHVANAGYVVAEEARGQGIAAAMCEHSQSEALAAGFRAMQFNYVVATNEPAVHLWQKQGFAIVGRLPGAFHHRSLGYVDALVMYKTLARPG
jgi:ribosomal protein S18 acetylase RimI-like enzyme